MCFSEDHDDKPLKYLVPAYSYVWRWGCNVGWPEASRQIIWQPKGGTKKAMEQTVVFIGSAPISTSVVGELLGADSTMISWPLTAAAPTSHQWLCEDDRGWGPWRQSTCFTWSSTCSTGAQTLHSNVAGHSARRFQSNGSSDSLSLDVFGPNCRLPTPVSTGIWFRSPKIYNLGLLSSPLSISISDISIKTAYLYDLHRLVSWIIVFWPPQIGYLFNFRASASTRHLGTGESLERDLGAGHQIRNRRRLKPPNKNSRDGFGGLKQQLARPPEYFFPSIVMDIIKKDSSNFESCFG